MKIPVETIREVAAKVDGLSVMQRYLQFKRQSGKNYLALCPFHAERTPSFNFNPEKKVWICYGCQEGGDIFHFVMKMDGLSFPQAVQKLGAECGVPVELEEEDPAQRSERERLLDVLERTAAYYHELLIRSPIAEEAREYLAHRGVEPPTWERFRLGWAPPSGYQLRDKLVQAGFASSLGAQAGVLRERDGRFFDTLKGRITFPICDPQDRVIALGGRTIGEGQPKYLNTPESPVYSKRNQLYGLNLARGAASRADEAIVVEGNLDVVMLHQAGFNRAVAALGTSLTPEQAALLKRYVQGVVIAYDSDRAGETASVKSIHIFEEAGLRVRVASLPRGEDPDSLLRKQGAPGLQACLDQAQAVVDYMIDSLSNRLDLSRPEGKEDFLKAMVPVLNSIQNPNRRNIYIARVARLGGALEAGLAEQIRPANRTVAAARPPSRATRFDPDERLLRLLAHDSRWLSLAGEHLSWGSFREDLQGIARRLFESAGPADPLPPEEEGMLRKWTELLVQEPPESTADDVLKLIQPIKERAAMQRIEELRRIVLPALESGKLSSDDELVQEYMELKRRHKGKVAP